MYLNTNESMILILDTMDTNMSGYSEDSTAGTNATFHFHTASIRVQLIYISTTGEIVNTCVCLVIAMLGFVGNLVTFVKIICDSKLLPHSCFLLQIREGHEIVGRV